MENGKPKAPLILFIISCVYFAASLVCLAVAIITLTKMLSTGWNDSSNLSLIGLIASAFVRGTILLFSVCFLFGASFVSAVLSLLSAKKDPGRFGIPGTVISVISSVLCVLSLGFYIWMMFILK